MVRDASPTNSVQDVRQDHAVNGMEELAHEAMKHAAAGWTRQFSFKNRILISTLLVLVGGVITIAAILQIAVFPWIRGDPEVITRLKTLHMLASVVVVAVSWIFVEIISKRISGPLMELTNRADEISREAGEKLLHGPSGEFEALKSAGEASPPSGDEITRLKTSFYRMLAHLRASEAHLRESEAKYRFLFDNAPIPLFVLDADDMHVLDANARAEHEYQYTRDELLGKTFWDLGGPSAADLRHGDRIQMVDPREYPMPIFQHHRKDGSVFMTHIQARLSQWKGMLAIIVGVWDVTEKLEREAILLQTGKMATLGEMATGIAHELNQPLNVIKLASDFLLKNISRGRSISTEELADTARELGANVDRAARIIGHLRDFGRKSEVRMNPVNLNDVIIKGVSTLLGAQLAKSGIICELSLAETLPFIRGDENMLEQVFINLVINARDALLIQEGQSSGNGSHKQKRLSIRTFSSQNKVIALVSDNGPGIPRAMRTRIFEPFFTTKKVGEGTGIGLSISYSIVKQHDGTIEVVGTEKRGATFRLTFPTIDVPPENIHDEDPHS